MRRLNIPVLFLALLLLRTASGPALAAEGGFPFRDVQDNAAVEYVYGHGLMKGTGEGRFSPDMPLSRAMMAAILWRMEKEPAGEGQTFPDVPSDAWYADAVSWASGAGLVKGYPGGAFGPDDSLTREQMAVLFFRYAGVRHLDVTPSGGLDGFSDRDAVSSYAVDALRWAVGNSLLPRHNGSLTPGQEAVREEVAEMLMAFCLFGDYDRLEEPGHWPEGGTIGAVLTVLETAEGGAKVRLSNRGSGTFSYRQSGFALNRLAADGSRWERCEVLRTGSQRVENPLEIKPGQSVDLVCSLTSVYGELPPGEYQLEWFVTREGRQYAARVSFAVGG